MIAYIIIYIIVGIIAGIIGTETDEKKNWSYGIIIIGAIISLLSAGPFVIAAIIEMIIGFGIATSIKSNMDSIIIFFEVIIILALKIFGIIVVGAILIQLLRLI